MKKFRYEINGYSRKDVNKFVSYVVSEMEDLIERVQVQRKEIESLKNKISKYQERENDLEDAFQRIDETSEQVRLLAVEEKKLIIDEAKQYASRIVNDALLRAEEIENDKQEFEENARLWKNQLENLIEEQRSVLEKLNQIDVS